VQFVNYCYEPPALPARWPWTWPRDEEAEHAIVNCIDRTMVVHPACTNGRRTTVASRQW